jgi:hypothetical protein
VRRRSLWLTIIAGVVVFLVVLVFYLPASWFAGSLPPQVRCRELGGSIWHGECLGLTFSGAALGDATWNLAPARAFMGRLTGDLAVSGAGLDARGGLDTSFGGVGEMHQVSVSFTLDPALLPQLPRGLGGHIVAELNRVELGSGPAARAIDGRIELTNLRQAGDQPMELGSYEVTFDGSTGAQGQVPGKLHDIGGPYKVDGTVTLTPPNAYLVQGYITGRTADAERVVREITLGVPPDSAGRSTFSFEGTY